MATAGTFPRARAVWGVLGACACALVTALAAAAQSHDVVLDIVTSPQHYWNRTVTVRGHVRSVTADPPGTSRGTYVLRDSSDADITIETRELPAPGKEFTVTGNVVPATATSMSPLLREARRRAVGELPPPKVVQTPVPVFQAAPPSAEAAPAAESPAPVSSAPAPVATTVVPVPAVQPAANGLSMNGLVFALIGVVALFSVVMIVAFWPRPQARPATNPRWEPAGPSMIVLPPRGPKHKERFAEAEVVVDQDVSVDSATRIVPPPGQRALAQATEVYLDVGARLEVTDGPDKGKIFDLFKPRIGIGRPGSRENEVMLSDLTVSREHASIVYSPADKTFRVVNESATNPARVNGTPVDEAVLGPDDVIQLGASVLAFRRRA